MYYALFHAMCRNVADCFIGGRNADRSRPAWTQAYRAIQHGFAAAQCKNGKIVKKFPAAIQDFANVFVAAQERRVSADYDPTAKFDRSPVLAEIEAAAVAMRAFSAASIKDRRAFAAWVTINNR